jgi:hypothetical protein
MTSNSAVSEEEMERRQEEYRQFGWQARGPAHVVYHEKDQPCPWSECTLRIAGIDFQIHKVADSQLCERLMAAWWKGPGLLGRCPGCAKYVLFKLTRKETVFDIGPLASALLPDDWHQRAYLVTKPHLQK